MNNLIKKVSFFSLALLLSTVPTVENIFAEDINLEENISSYDSKAISQERSLKLNSSSTFKDIPELNSVISMDQYANSEGNNFEDSYELKIDYNEYKTKIYIKTHLNESMDNGPSYKAISFLIENYDDFKSYMSHLNDGDFVDLIYSITTTYNNLDEKDSNPWKESLLSKSDSYKQYFQNNIRKKRAISGYDATNAVAYAKKYHGNNSPSPNYYSFSNDGGDCTNFVSQCLKAGNMSMRKYDNDIWNNSNWYYYGSVRNWPTAYSGSWAQASNF